MWTCKKYYDDNIQKFTKERMDGQDIVYAPILIGDRYEIIGILSDSGGFGIIYNSIDKRLNDRKVLIKARKYNNVLGLFSHKNDLSREEQIQDIREDVEFEIEALKYFKRRGEARLPSLNDVIEDFSPSLYGPHIDEQGEEFYYENSDVYDSEPYIVMQMIEGENLGDYVDKGIDYIMKDRGYTSINQWEFAVMQYALELTSILKHIHECKPTKYGKYKEEFFIYQDLKPHNIIITNDTFITLLDFGGVLLVRRDKNGNTKSNFKGTGTPGVGTYGYMAPEVKKGSYELSRLDERVDIYSFGATLFHLLTAKSLNKSISNENERIPIEELIKMNYTLETCNLVKKCIEENKEDRFVNMNSIKCEIFEVLKAIKKGK